jgi:predicted RNA-binding Zn-ribbon protein involved in translation (DUF1610 family)
MLNATVINLPENDEDIVIDHVICPHCGSEMVRNKMDNPYTINGRSYVCESCGADEIISPCTEEEIY